MSLLDPTLVIEQMARRLRAGGATHPVAGAVSLAARGHARMAQIEFAQHADLLVDLVRSSERGEVAFGDLPASIGSVATAAGADLLALADLEMCWRTEPPVEASGP